MTVGRFLSNSNIAQLYLRVSRSAKWPHTALGLSFRKRKGEKKKFSCCCYFTLHFPFNRRKSESRFFFATGRYRIRDIKRDPPSLIFLSDIYIPVIFFFITVGLDLDRGSCFVFTPSKNTATKKIEGFLKRGR